MPRGPKFRIKNIKGPDGEELHQWQLVAGNGKVIVESTAIWPKRYQAVENARAVKVAAKGAKIIHQEEG